MCQFLAHVKRATCPFIFYFPGNVPISVSNCCNAIGSISQTRVLDVDSGFDSATKLSGTIKLEHSEVTDRTGGTFIVLLSRNMKFMAGLRPSGQIRH